MNSEPRELRQGKVLHQFQDFFITIFLFAILLLIERWRVSYYFLYPYSSYLLVAYTVYLWLIVLATTIGIIIGAMPGFGSANTIIMLLPFTLAVDVEVAMIFMVSLFVASHMGGGKIGRAHV